MKETGLYYNSEGYADPTAYAGIRNVIREEKETKRRAFELIKIVKLMIRMAGFEPVERIKIRDARTGREFK